VIGTYTVPLQDLVGAAGQGAEANVTLTKNGQGNFSVGTSDPNSFNAVAQPDGGPFMSLAQIIRSVFNPGSPPRTFTTAAGGTIVVFDSQGKQLLNGSLNASDPSAAPASISQTVDSSCSGQTQATAQCPNPRPVGLNISLGKDLVTVPSQVNFSITLNIAFADQ
jgi:hypothetical protein